MELPGFIRSMSTPRARAAAAGDVEGGERWAATVAPMTPALALALERTTPIWQQRDPGPLPVCGVCWEEATTPGRRGRLFRFADYCGARGRCGHVLCVACAVAYVRAALRDAAGAFPLRCPECAAAKLPERDGDGGAAANAAAPGPGPAAAAPGARPRLEFTVAPPSPGASPGPSSAVSAASPTSGADLDSVHLDLPSTPGGSASGALVARGAARGLTIAVPPSPPGPLPAFSLPAAAVALSPGALGRVGVSGLEALYQLSAEWAASGAVEGGGEDALTQGEIRKERTPAG